MTPQELKASILQLAIQGKLVEQHPSDEPVPVDTMFCGDTSDFFEIPEKWKWLPIKDVASVNTGLSFKKPDQRDSSNGSLRVLRGGNIGDDYKYHLYEDDIYVDLNQFQTKYIQLLQDDIITPSVTSMEKICKTGFIDRDLPAVTAGGFVYIIRCLDKSVIDPRYLLYFISSSFNKEQCKPNIHKSGQAFYNLKKSGFIEQPICMPPLAEQKRIVAKIEELLPYIDRYEQAWSRLEAFNKRFPVDMQKSILQMAIQGKLVEQRPEEGTGEELYQQIQAEKQALIKSGKIKKEKPLSEITEDEIPFDVPESWKWIKVGNLAVVQSSKRVFEKDYVSSGIPFFRSKEIGDLSRNEPIKTELFITEEHYKALAEGYGVPQIGDILITSVGTIGNTWICDGRKFYYKDGNITQICGNRFFDSKFVEYFLHSPLFEKQALSTVAGTAYSALTIIKLKNLIMPLPPLAEQKRIVAKLEEILPLCERLK